MPKTLAIIPARGGSKTIPKKNIRLLDGKPLIAYAIESCKDSESVDRIIVSTDDDEIAKISLNYGAEVFSRPDNISGDEVASELALLHVLDQLKKKESYTPDFVFFVQCTSPLLAPIDIDSTFHALLDSNADMSHAVTLFHGFIWEKDSDNNAIAVNHDPSMRLRRQDLTPQYQETGAVYVMKAKEFISVKNRFFGKIAFCVIPPQRSIEINDYIEFEIAEHLIKKYKQLKSY